MMVYLFLTLSAAALTHLADGQSSRETERFLIDSPYNLCRQPLYRRQVVLSLGYLDRTMNEN